MIEGRKAKAQARRERFRRWLDRQRDRVIRETRVGAPALKAIIALSVLALAGCTEADRRLARETQAKIEAAAQMQAAGFGMAGILFHMFPAARAQQPAGGGGGGGGGGGNYRAPTTAQPVNTAFSTLTGLWTGSPYWGSSAPSLPSHWLTGTITRVSDATAFQNAINAATRGVSIVEIPPGVVIVAPTGGFSWPAFTGTGRVIVRTGTATGPMEGLPAFGGYVTKASHSSLMGGLQGAPLGGERTLKIAGATGLGNVCFSGIRFIGPAADTSNMCELGGSLDNTSLLPANCEFDRCTFEGDPNRNHRRGLQVHSDGASIIGCDFTGFADTNTDAQGIAAWHFGRRVHIENCFIEGAAENFMLGGATANTPASTVEPQDWMIYRCHFRKPVAWKGGARIIKNIFEVKFGNRILLWGSVLNQIWFANGQHGAALNLKTSVDAGHLQAHNITVRYNKIFDAGMVASLSAGEAGLGITPIAMSDVDICDNLCWNINTATFNTDTVWFYCSLTAGQSINNVTVDHNSILKGPNGRPDVWQFSGDKATGTEPSCTGWLLSNNLIEGGTGAANTTGIRWGGVAEGQASINYWMNMALCTVRNNAMLNRNAVAAQYTPVGSAWSFPTQATAGFADYANGDYRITGGTALNAGSDGRSLGADVALVNTLTAGVERP